MAQRTLAVLPPETLIRLDYQKRGINIGKGTERSELNNRIDTYHKRYGELLNTSMVTFVQESEIPVDFLKNYRELPDSIQSDMRRLAIYVESEMDRLYEKKQRGLGIFIGGETGKQKRKRNESSLTEYGPRISQAMNCRYLMMMRATGYHYDRRKKFPEDLYGGFAYETIIVDLKEGETLYYNLQWHGKAQEYGFTAMNNDDNKDILGLNGPKEIKATKFVSRIRKEFEKALARWQRLAN